MLYEVTQGWVTRLGDQARHQTAAVWNDMIQSASMTGITHMLITVLAIALAGWALQAVRFDVLLKDPKGGKAKMLQILLAIVIGYMLASFILDYLSWSSIIRHGF